MGERKKKKKSVDSFESVKTQSFHFFCVPTPFMQKQEMMNLSLVFSRQRILQKYITKTHKYGDIFGANK